MLKKTPEICLAAVKQIGGVLRYVKKQTLEICLAAVKQDGFALRYMQKQTPEICLEAVKTSTYSLMYVKEQTPEICFEAIKNDGKALVYVREQTPEICVEAIKELCKTGDKYIMHNIFYIVKKCKYITHEMIMTIVSYLNFIKLYLYKSSYGDYVCKFIYNGEIYCFM